MAQNAPVQNNRVVQDNERTRQDLVTFDQFLDSHPRLAGQIHNDPSLVNNVQFVKHHPALRDYLDDHPTVREEIKENPDAFTAREELHARRVDIGGRDRDREFGRAQDRDQDQGPTRQQLAEFDRFLDKHQDIATELRQKPWLATNYEYLQAHPELNTFLNQHPELREQVGKNPSAFVTQDNRFDNAGYRRELANFDQFLDKHHEIAEQVRKNPSLVNNDEFVKNHPALQTYLKDHPGVREEMKENPNAFMNQEARNERSEGNGVRDHDRGRDADRDRDSLHRQFGEFLGEHSSVAQQLSKDPSQVKNEEFMANHPELKEYLNSHPDVQQELMKNPQTFVSSSQKFSTGTSGTGTVKSPSTTAAPTTEPKPKQ